MTTAERECRPTLEASRSRLAQALLRLRQSMERSRSQAAQSDALFADWQEKWASRRDQINYRLTLIESELEALAKPSKPVRLSLVGKDEA